MTAETEVCPIHGPSTGQPGCPYCARTSKTESYVIVCGGDGYATAIVHSREEMERGFVRALWPDADFNNLDEEQRQMLAYIQDEDQWETDSRFGRIRFGESYEDGWIVVSRLTGDLFGAAAETTAERSIATAADIIRTFEHALVKIDTYSPASTVQPVQIAREALTKAYGPNYRSAVKASEPLDDGKTKLAIVMLERFRDGRLQTAQGTHETLLGPRDQLLQEADWFDHAVKVLRATLKTSDDPAR